MEDKELVLIVGGGPSGLVTAKYALQEGFQPIILEKAQDIGGVWNPKTGAVWQFMTTNLSKYTCCFKGVSWSEETPLFPSSSQVQQYLKRYANAYNLLKYIKFLHKVERITLDETQKPSKYIVICQTATGFQEYTANYLVVCSGIFAEPYIPKIQGISSFQGEVLHSKFYRQSENTKGKKVLIVGGSFTATQLASHIAKQASEVVHVYRKPFWIMEHRIKTQLGAQDEKILYSPIDFNYNRKFYNEQEVPIQEKIFKKNLFYGSVVCSEQQNQQKLKISEEIFTKPINLTISSHYTQFVNHGKIKPLLKEIQSFNSSTVIFSDDSAEEGFDMIIFCTGFHSGLSFLPEKVKELGYFKEDDSFLPLILYKSCCLPSLKNISFVGMYKGPYFGVLQLQAQFAFKYFKGKIQIQKEQADKNMEQMRKRRDNKNRPQFPYDYVKQADDIAIILKKLPNMCRQQERKKLPEQFISMPVFASVRNSFTGEDIAEQIRESAQIKKKNAVYL